MRTAISILLLCCTIHAGDLADAMKRHAALTSRPDKPDILAPPPAQNPTPTSGEGPAVSPTRDTAICFGPTWYCQWCEWMRGQDYSGIDLAVRFEKRSDADMDAYLKLIGYHRDWSWPVTIWKGADDRYKVYSGAVSPKNLEWSWQQTQGGKSEQKPQPQQGKLCQCVAVTGNRQAYCPCLPLGKGCHCSPSRPHKFE